MKVRKKNFMKFCNSHVPTTLSMPISYSATLYNYKYNR